MFANFWSRDIFEFVFLEIMVVLFARDSPSLLRRSLVWFSCVWILFFCFSLIVTYCLRAPCFDFVLLHLLFVFLFSFLSERAFLTLQRALIEHSSRSLVFDGGVEIICVIWN